MSGRRCDATAWYAKRIASSLGSSRSGTVPSASCSAASVGGSAYGSNIGDIYPARLPEPAGKGRDAGAQAAAQIIALVVTVAIAIPAGILTAKIVSVDFFQPHKPWSECHKRKSFVDVAWEDGDEDADVEVGKAAVVPQAVTTTSAIAANITTTAATSRTPVARSRRALLLRFCACS